MLYDAFSAGVALTEGTAAAVTESKPALCSQTSLIIAFLEYSKSFAGYRITVLAGLTSYIASKAEFKEGCILSFMPVHFPCNFISLFSASCNPSTCLFVNLCLEKAPMWQARIG